MLIGPIYRSSKTKYKKGEINMYEEIGLILVVAIVVGLVYMRLYYVRFNRIIQGQGAKKRLYKLAPGTVNVFLLVLSLVSVAFLSLHRIEVLAQEVAEYEEIILNDPYRDLEDDYGVIATAYKQYNPYFAGFIIENGSYILYITEDSPDSLITLLETSNHKYRLVRYNYATLHQLMQTILNDVNKDDNFVSLTVNIKENIVVLGLKDPNINTPLYEEYLVNGLLKIVEDEPMEVLPLIK